MIIVECDKVSKGRVRTHEVQVDEAEAMSVEDGALVLRDKAGTVAYIFASGDWKNAHLLQELVIKNRADKTLIKEPLTEARIATRMVDAA